MASLVFLALALTAVFASDFEADLISGESKINGPGISWVSALTTPTKNLGTCGCHKQGVVKLTFNTSDRTKAEITFSLGKSKGYTFDIGDSHTNDGYGGDLGTQSNDAEVHSHDTALLFFGRDKAEGGHYGVLDSYYGFIRRGDVKITVEDSLVTAESGAKIIYFHSEQLFQLKGQADAEGPVNYDVYIGLNRVIDTDSLNGTGLCAVEVNWV
ncbi:uncharacterized protein [Littorina saxatilis]|uniref:Uncharacterized protein n=2 Tax=Littorina saxatilis TaxID=31220 RepID=A0AAN9B6A7_9CAEN